MITLLSFLDRVFVVHSLISSYDRRYSWMENFIFWDPNPIKMKNYLERITTTWYFHQTIIFAELRCCAILLISFSISKPQRIDKIGLQNKLLKTQWNANHVSLISSLPCIHKEQDGAILSLKSFRVAAMG